MLTPSSLQSLVVSIFIITYILVVIFYHKKTYFVWATAILFLLMGILTPFEALKSVNWNVIGIYVGMLFISEIFIYSKIPDFLAERIVTRSSRVWIAMLGVCFLSGVISIAVENVAVVLIMAPIALFVAEKLKINPANLVIGIAISSNLQGVATMIGDPPSLLLTHYANLNFNDFFFFQGKPGLFFAVQIAAIISLAVLYLFFKQYNKKSGNIKAEKIKSAFPGIALIGMIALLALTSLFEYTGPSWVLSVIAKYQVGFICMAVGMITWLWYYKKEKKDFFPLLKRLDWETGLFLVAIFILVEALVKVKFMQILANAISSLTGNNVFLAFNIIIWSSVLFSGFVDNVPFIAAMLPVVANLANIMGIPPYLFFFGLVIGASVGGNVTPVGASANIVAMGILKKKGYKPSFGSFVKIGLPFTIVSVFASGLFIWLFFS